MNAHYCHKCRRVTQWNVRRAFEVCAECSDRWPCRRACAHIDCNECRIGRDLAPLAVSGHMLRSETP